MIALTSIAPNHHHEGIQQLCVQSWIAHGLKVYSFNSHAEAEALQPLYPDITFVPTYRTLEHRLGRPYVQVNALLDFAKEQEDEHILLINSDIYLYEAAESLRKGFMLTELGIVYAHRRDFKDEAEIPNGKPMTSGMDIFFVNKRHLHIYPQTMFCIGQTHWDYWIPYEAKKAGLQVMHLNESFAFHKEHPQRWSVESWLDMAQYALWQTAKEGPLKIPDHHRKKQAQQVSAFMYNTFMKS